MVEKERKETHNFAIFSIHCDNSTEDSDINNIRGRCGSGFTRSSEENNRLSQKKGAIISFFFEETKKNSKTKNTHFGAGCLRGSHTREF